MTLLENNTDSVERLFHEARSGDIIAINIAQFGKRKMRPQELSMRQLKKGFSVELNPVLKCNIARSKKIMGELVDSGAETVTNTQVKCPCCGKQIKLLNNGTLITLKTIYTSILKAPAKIIFSYHLYSYMF